MGARALQGLRRRLWVVLLAALAAYFVWTTIGLQQPPIGASPAARPQPATALQMPGAPAGRQAAAPAPRTRDETFILPSAGAVTHNSVVSISGYGFEKGEAIAVEFRGKVVGKATADKGGSFAGVNITIGTDLAPGKYPIRAIGTGLLAESIVEIVPGMPYIQPSTYFGKPAGRVSFAGGGFRRGERVSIHFDTLAAAPLGELTGGEIGEVAVKDLVVPFAPEGQHTFIFLGQESRSPATVPFSVLGFYPWVTLSNYNVPPQRAIGLSGQDWAPDEQVLVYLNAQPGDQAGNAVTPAAVVRADGRGRLDAADVLSFPPEAIGKNTIFLRGQMSGKAVAATLTVEPFAPQLELTEYAGQPNTEVAFVGQGYARREKLTAYLGDVQGGQRVATFEADDDGSFKKAGAFRIPFGTPAGKQSITVVGETSKVPTAIVFAVLPMTPSFTLSSYAGRPGDAVSVSGGGFAAGERVRIYVGEQARGQEVASAEVDPKGAFKDAGSFDIPTRTRPGKLKLTAWGEQSRTPVSAEFEVLPPEAWGVLSTYAGPPGTAIQFSGRGYVAGEEVLIYAGDRQSKPVARAKVGADGAFQDAGPYIVPANAREAVSFILVGRTSEAEAKATFTVTVGGAGESEPGGSAGESDTTADQPTGETAAPDRRR
ncbi:MAG: hypothetical protein HY331_12750 [Chloroflexi bacterium]|nr:hypothetical protein [Chloroflexota bacterium]